MFLVGIQHTGPPIESFGGDNSFFEIGSSAVSQK
jgi:hypothetical protein